jgi:hypothetical protein
VLWILKAKLHDPCLRGHSAATHQLHFCDKKKTTDETPCPVLEKKMAGSVDWDAKIAALSEDEAVKHARMMEHEAAFHASTCAYSAWKKDTWYEQRFNVHAEGLRTCTKAGCRGELKAYYRTLTEWGRYQENPVGR